MKTATHFGQSFLLLVWLFRCAALQPETGLVASGDVPAEVAAETRGLAEEQPSLKAAREDARVVYVGTEPTRQKTNDGEKRLAKAYRVIHYR